MTTRPLFAAAALSALMLGLAACGDSGPDVIQAGPDGEAQPAPSTTAQMATTQTAVALGMTREQLESADLLSRELTDLGDVEALIINARNEVTHLVIDLEGPGDDVVVPIDQVTSHRDAAGDVDLITDLTSAQLQAMPAWTGTPEAGSSIMRAPVPPGRATPPSA